MRCIWIVSTQPYAEADAKETAKQKAEEEAKAAAKTNGAGAPAAAAAKKDGKKEKKVGCGPPPAAQCLGCLTVHQQSRVATWWRCCGLVGTMLIF